MNSVESPPENQSNLEISNRLLGKLSRRPDAIALRVSSRLKVKVGGAKWSGKRCWRLKWAEAHTVPENLPMELRADVTSAAIERHPETDRPEFL